MRTIKFNKIKKETIMASYDKTVAKLQKTLDKLETRIAICPSQNEMDNQDQTWWKYHFSLPNAIMFANGRLSKIYGNDLAFEWNRNISMPDAFDDINFRYRGRVFSVLIKIYYNGEELPIDPARKKKFLKIAKQNDLVPCVFPVDITDDGDQYKICCSNEDHELCMLETGKPIPRTLVLSDRPVERTRFDFISKSINVICARLDEQGFEIDKFYDDPSLPDYFPRIWFYDEEGVPCWVVVQYATRKKDIQKPEVAKIIKNDKLLQCTKGYFAPVVFNAKGRPVYRNRPINVSTLEDIMIKINDGGTWM